MSAYKRKRDGQELEQAQLFGGSFSEKMRATLNRKIAAGKAGINLNDYKENAARLPQVIRYYDHEMGDDVFDLACAIHAQGIALDYREWVHWMTDAQIFVSSAQITVRHRSLFFCRYADKALGSTLRQYFQRPVWFIPDNSIKTRVEST